MQYKSRPLIWPPIFPVDKNLVLWLPISDRSGSILRDRSGQRNNGTLSGPSWVAGCRGSALSFDGGDSVSLSKAPSLGADFTYILSLYLTGYGAKRANILRHLAGSYEVSLRVKATGDGRFEVVTQNAGGRVDINSVDAIPLNAWTDVALVRSDVDNEMRVYFNGVENNSAADTRSGTFPLTTSLDLAPAQAGFGQYAGLLQYTRIYTRALTAARLSRLAESERPLVRF